MSNDTNKVIPFPVWRESTWVPYIRQVKVWAMVHELQTWPHFYWENIHPDLEHAWDFIKTLFSSGSVTISTEGTDITNYAKLSVSTWDEYPLELYAKDFLCLICQHPPKDMGEYITRWLTWKNIRIWFSQDDSSHEESTLEIGDIDNYQIENIQARIDNIEYSVDLHFGEGIAFWLADVDDFDENASISLLDMILCAFDDAETFNEIGTRWVSMDITYQESEDTGSIKHIRAELVDKVIYGALMRINATLYGTMDFESARRHYFHHHVIPKLSGIKMS